jgi:golgi-specific brefeldin A-resistance guanine nucleotide exchange factor 1
LFSKLVEPYLLTFTLELLRKTAEQALRDMIHLLFMRLPQFADDLDSSTLNHLKIRSEAKTTKSKGTSHWNEKQPTATIKRSESVEKAVVNETEDVVSIVSTETDQNNEIETNLDQNDTDEKEAQEQTQVQSVSDDSVEDTKIFNDSELKPYGIACIRELFRFVISLCNPLDQHNTENVLHIALDLLTVVFEVSSDNLASYYSLIELVKDELCRNLFTLIQSEKLNLFASSLRLSFLLFESLRFHLKFQLEYFLVKLMDIIGTESPKFTHEIKELALENIMQLLQIPGFAAEVYINYDCDLYCEDIFEKLSKLLSKNVMFVSGIHSVNEIQVLSLEALLAVISSINKNCELSKVGNRVSYMRHSRNSSLSRPQDFKPNDSQADMRLELTNFNTSRFADKIKMGGMIDDKKIDELRNRKRILAQGTELFNQRSEKGIQFLQENGVLNSNFDTMEIGLFLRESPGLDKKMIGEYISKKKNVEKGILDAFVKSFDFTSLRIDKALRLYLETFRLPGEAPLIFLVMEQFASHFIESDQEHFANADAAFRLAYAIIMLNMDQHNHNAKKLNVPMTVDDFIKNLRGLNGNSDFDQQMLSDIYNSIK